MEHYPSINTSYYDTYPLDEFVLIAYPCFLAFGKPFLNSLTKELNFNQNSYLKIIPCYYKQWISLFKKIMKHNTSENQNFQEFTLFQRNQIKLKCFYFNFKYHLVFENLELPTSDTINISLTLIQIQDLYKGIQTLFFNPLLITKSVIFLLYNLINNTDFDQISTLSQKNILSFCKSISKNCNIETDIFLLNIPEVILRYKTYIMLNKQLLELLPEA